MHASPVWMQNDAPSRQVPSLHKVEQHCELSVHGFPAVRHDRLRGWQTPAVQLPLHQADESVHAWLSATQADEHLPLVHAIEQHSVPAPHGPLVAVHWLMDDAQVLVVGSQTFEQQSAPVSHC